MSVTNTVAFLIVFVPAVLNLGILFYLFILPKRNYSNNFMLIMIALLMWQTEDMLSRSLMYEYQIQFWDRMLSLGWIAVAPLIFHFSLRFSSRKFLSYNHGNILIYLPFAIFYMVYVSNPQNISFIHHPFWGWISTPRPGSWDILQRHVISVLIFLSTGILLSHYIKSRFSSKRKKMQSLIIAIGLLIPTIQGTITQVIFPAYFNTEVPITSSVMTFFSMSVILAISRYRLFEVSDSIEVNALIENLNSVVVVLSPKGKVIFYNDFTARLFKLPPLSEPADLRQYYGIEEYRKIEQDLINPTLAGEVITNYELPLRHFRRGRIWLSITTELIVNNGNIQGILVVGHDITERKNSREKLAAQNKALRKIAYTQSHVVRAPLARILGLMSLLKISDNLDAENREILENLKISAAELDEVIREIVKSTAQHE